MVNRYFLFPDFLINNISAHVFSTSNEVKSEDSIGLQIDEDSNGNTATSSSPLNEKCQPNISRKVPKAQSIDFNTGN